MKKNIGLLLIIVIMLMGCATEENKVDFAYAPVVCEYTTAPTCWTVVDCISTNVKVYANNTVEVYCGDFYDSLGLGEEISIEYIYGETFKITEEQKQGIIDVLEKNKKALFAEEEEDDVCDGDFSYIILFDENGEKVHWFEGTGKYGENFRHIKEKMDSVLPEKTVVNVRDKSTEVLVDYLLENYPERYDWLAEEKGR